ncbi:MAG TPA: hypothetical protein VM580_34080 [Labilithrix sp.]|nr:hypothetical protein [Labilithrix sp.]
MERDVYGSGVKELELGEGDFTESQMARVHDGLRALEEVCASVFDRKAAEHTAQSVQDLVNRGEAAKREAARFETDAEARRVEVAALDAQIAAKRAELYASAEAKV